MRTLRGILFLRLQVAASLALMNDMHDTIYGGVLFDFDLGIVDTEKVFVQCFIGQITCSWSSQQLRGTSCTVLQFI